MPQYKLIYFNSKGLGELPRLLFAMAGVEYEDHRMANREEFQEKYKHVVPTGKVPVLEIDGKMYPESAAIARYLAKEFNLYGKDNLEALQCDGVMDVMNEFHMIMMPILMEQDEVKKEEIKKKAIETDIPAVLTLLEKLVGGEVFVGDSITIADIAFFRVIDTVMAQTKDILDNYPKLKAIKDKVAKEPKIAAWVAKRPDTPW